MTLKRQFLKSDWQRAVVALVRAATGLSRAKAHGELVTWGPEQVNAERTHVEVRVELWRYVGALPALERETLARADVLLVRQNWDAAIEIVKAWRARDL